MQPVMPGSMEKLLDLLGVASEARTFAALEAGETAVRLNAARRLTPGAALPAPAAVFPRYVEPEALKP
jgi:methionyl-tRNA synthetase